MTNSITSPAPSKAATRKRGVSAFITVQEGCDKFCTFCVVPYTRGSEISRPVDKIVAEAERLADAGVREITLIGQNVNAYHGDDVEGRACDARPPAASARGNSGHRAAALHHEPSARHGVIRRQPDRRASRSAGADAAAASAGAVGPDRMLERDEPPPHPRRLSARWSSGCAPRGPTSPFRRTSSSDFPARATKISRTPCGSWPRWDFVAAYTFKYSPRAGTPAADMEQVAEDAEGRTPATAAARHRAPADRVPDALPGRHLRCAVRPGRPPSRPDFRALAVSPDRAGRWRRHL